MTDERRFLHYLIAPVVILSAVVIWADLSDFEPLVRLHDEMAGARTELTLLGERWSGFISGEGERLEAASREAEFFLYERCLRDTAAENLRLRETLELRLRSPWRLLTVEVIPSIPPALAAGGFYGVREGQAVLVDDWLVGLVGRVAEDSAELVPLGDPRLRLGVRLARTRRTGVLVSRRGELWIDHLAADVLPEEGELVVTSGLGDLPPGIQVGRVGEVNWEPGALELTCGLGPVTRIEGAGFAHLILSGSR